MIQGSFFGRDMLLFLKKNHTEYCSVGEKFSSKNAILLWIVQKILNENGEFLAKNGEMRYFFS